MSAEPRSVSEAGSGAGNGSTRELAEKLIVDPAESVNVRLSVIEYGEASGETLIELVALYEPIAAIFGLSAGVLNVAGQAFCPLL
jgi:hypothetical protein